MTGTPLAGTEVMMTRPPNYRPKGGGILRERTRSPDDCLCRYSRKEEKAKRLCRETVRGSRFGEQPAAGCPTIGELAERLIREIFVKRLAVRTSRLFPPWTADLFRDEAHRKRINSTAATTIRGSPPFTAAVFLLSADPLLWKKSRQALRGGAVDFGRINHSGISAAAYALLRTAKDLYHGGCRITVEELCDARVTGDRLFCLILGAFVIRRYGLPFETLTPPQFPAQLLNR
jgi:hypothetical protein